MPKTVSQLHTDLWKVFSQYIRLRDAHRDYSVLDDLSIALCISCSKPYPIGGRGCLQAGDFITRGKGSIKYDERNVHAQCYNCNLNLKGNWPNYYEAMQRMYGQAVIDELMQARNETHQFKTNELEDLIVLYKEKLHGLQTKTP